MVGNAAIKEKFMLCTKLYYVPKATCNYQNMCRANPEVCMGSFPNETKCVWNLKQIVDLSLDMNNSCND